MAARSAAAGTAAAAALPSSGTGGKAAAKAAVTTWATASLVADNCPRQVEITVVGYAAAGSRTPGAPGTARKCRQFGSPRNAGRAAVG